MTDTSTKAISGMFESYRSARDCTEDCESQKGAFVDMIEALAAEREALQADLERSKQQTLRSIDQTERLLDERNAVRVNLSVATGALSKIGIRMELTGDELQQIAWKAMAKIKGGE